MDRRGGTTAGMVVVVGGVALFAVFALVLVVMWTSSGRSAEARAREERRAALASLEIPAFSVRAQDGREVTRADLEGRWTVLSFGFTHCTTLCPIMHGQMHRVQEMVGGDGVAGRGARLLTISVDPVHDTVERLAAYSAQVGADPRVWTFARADEETLDRLMVRALGQGMSVDESMEIDLGGGETMRNIDHSSRLLLVSPEVEVVGMYRGTDPGDVDRLVIDLKKRLGVR